MKIYNDLDISLTVAFSIPGYMNSGISNINTEKTNMNNN